MASMAPQAARRQSNAPATGSSQDSAGQRLDERMEDSQTVLVSRPTPDTNDQDVKKCWICFSDESEDGPETSAWRDPCPCALVAHEDCLLDWIADMESPTSRKRTLGPPHIVCPQCKADIHLVRPRDPLVEVVRAMERLAAKLVAPAALTVAMSSVVHACVVHGVYTINSIFGPQDAMRILRPLMINAFNPPRTFKDLFQDLFTHWRLRVGLPLITPLLVLSRTTLADSVLPVLPIVFFATQGDSDQPINFGSWPPSASMTVAVLPYIRSLYNLYYARVWADRQKQWLKDIQPRSGQQDPQAPAPEDPIVEQDNNFEIRIDGNIWEDWAGADDQEDDVAPPLNAPPLPDDAPIPPQNQQQPRPQQPQPPAQGNQERLLSISTTAVAESVMGALIFPTIASLSGDALRYLLPKSWTHAPISSLLGAKARPRASGLLQEKWGRSIVGGCLFVVIKDAVMLYVRYKMAQQHHRRRVLDYDRKAKKPR